MRYGSLDDVMADADRVVAAESAGQARALGNWTPGQVMQHIARFMGCSLDGFPGELPWIWRVLGRGMRLVLGGRLLAKAPPAGFRLPEGTAFLPDEGVSAAEGARDLAAVIDRVRAGDRFIPASPLLGKLTREQWIELHCRHAELHMSFVAIDGEPAAGV